MDPQLEIGVLPLDSDLCIGYYIGKNGPNEGDYLLWDFRAKQFVAKRQGDSTQVPLFYLGLDFNKEVHEWFADKAFDQWQYLPSEARKNVDTIVLALQNSEAAYFSADTHASELNYEIARRDNIGLWRTIGEWFKRRKQ
jgi:hypothetical protein